MHTINIAWFQWRRFRCNILLDGAYNSASEYLRAEYDADIKIERMHAAIIFETEEGRLAFLLRHCENA